MTSQPVSPYIARRATTRDSTGVVTQPLSAWRNEPAYVLLGDPGSGKTRSLAAEAEAIGANVLLARQLFLDEAPSAPQEDPIFIDALDEAFARNADRDMLTAILHWLRRRGCPRFRIACREVDWWSNPDARGLDRVLPGVTVKALHLEPLDDAEIQQALTYRGIADPGAFQREAKRYGVDSLLGNPLLLELTAQAVASNSGQWPTTRKAVYEAACVQLAKEHAPGHYNHKPGDTDRILDDAGTLAAILLTSHRRAIRLDGAASEDELDLTDLPVELELTHAQAALQRKVFATENAACTPIHRTIAEFLGARAIAKRIQGGLPMLRVLALVNDASRRPTPDLRGLLAWLAVHLHAEARAQLLRLDPLGFIVNGDAAALTSHERILLLQSLQEIARENPWFRRDQWSQHPFGPLANRDILDYYVEELQQPPRDAERRAFVECLLDALRHAGPGQEMPELGAPLAALASDAEAGATLQHAAYQAWRRHCPREEQHVQLRAWIDALRQGTIHDLHRQLTGNVLRDAYPELLTIDVLDFLPPIHRNLFPQLTRPQPAFSYQEFWRHRFATQTPSHLFEPMITAWRTRFPRGIGNQIDAWDVRAAAHELVRVGLESIGDQATPGCLHQWLAILVDEHGMCDSVGTFREKVAAWLQARPERMKEIAAHGFLCAPEDDKNPTLRFWLAENLLAGAELPRDWFRWLASRAEVSDDAAFVAWVVERVAKAALGPPANFDVMTAVEVETWVSRLARRHPSAEDRLRKCWALPTDHWLGEQHRRRQRQQAERQQVREQRSLQLAPLLTEIHRQPLRPDLLHKIANAYEGHYHDITGKLPTDRVSDLLGVPTEIALVAIQQLDNTLARDDIPSADEILDLATKGKMHVLRYPALLAARRACDASSTAWHCWSDDLASSLTAFWLTFGADEPPWFQDMAAQRSELIAPIFVRHALAQLRHKEPTTVAGLHHLASCESWQQMVAQCLPPLLRHLPTRLSEQARQHLSRDLLPALRRLPSEHAKRIIKEKLAKKSLDVGQRIAWLVALLRYDAAAAKSLVKTVGRDPRRGSILGAVLEQQRSAVQDLWQLDAATVQHLIEVLAPITPYPSESTAGPVTDALERGRTVDALLQNLGTNPDSAAGEALRSLTANRLLGPWQQSARFRMHCQREAARAASFQPPSPRQVAFTLANQRPANHADFVALLLAHLHDLRSELHGSPEFLLRWYWNDDKNRPKEENDCRDLLLGQLRSRLQTNSIDLQPESQAAAKKRIDLRATLIRNDGVRMTIPIEAKKSDHQEVWTAWQTQLIPRYTNDPTTGGHGIYLVLWFGVDTRRSPDGKQTQSAKEMQDLLAAHIAAAGTLTIEVAVLDLSWPAHAKR